jgi:lipopolysaccharide export system permease protein
MTWTPALKPQDVVALFSDQQVITAGSARRALEGGASARPASVYQMELQRGWAGPLGALVMLMLAAPVALVNFRSGGAQTLTACLGAGLLFMVVDGIFTALGESAAAAPVLAAWAAPLIFAGGGLTALLYMEG